MSKSGQPAGHGEHAVVRVDRDDRATRVHAPKSRSGDDSRPGADVEQAVPGAGTHRVKHLLDPLGEQCRHEELLVHLRRRRRDLPGGSIG